MTVSAVAGAKVFHLSQNAQTFFDDVTGRGVSRWEMMSESLRRSRSLASMRRRAALEGESGGTVRIVECGGIE